MDNKKVKQMICDAVKNSCKGNCGSIWWESTHDFFSPKYPNQILIVDGMYDMDSAFWYTPFKVSLTADQLRGK